MQRRLNIGIGLLHRPRLLILDEPTVGVDPQSRNAILESVERLSARGMAVLYTTHYMEEAERLCDRIGIIDRGELKAEGTRARARRARRRSTTGSSSTGSGDLEARRAACARLAARARPRACRTAASSWSSRTRAACCPSCSRTAAGAGVAVQRGRGRRAGPRGGLPAPDRQGAPRLSAVPPCAALLIAAQGPAPAAARPLRAAGRDRRAARARLDLRPDLPQRRLGGTVTLHARPSSTRIGGPAAQAFVTQVLGPLERSGLIALRAEPTPRRRRAARRPAARSPPTFVLPAGFSRRDRARAAAASCRCSANVDAPIGTQVARVDRAVLRRAGSTRSGSRRAAPARGGAAASRPRRPPRCPRRSRSPTSRRKNRQLDAGTFYAAGMAVFFLFFTVQFGDLEPARGAPRRDARAHAGRARSPQRDPRRQAAHEPRARRAEHGRAGDRDPLPARRALGQPARRRDADRLPACSPRPA